MERRRGKYSAPADRVIIGAGLTGMVQLSSEAAAFFRQKKCAVELLPAPDATHYWNEMKGPAIGLFHVTC